MVRLKVRNFTPHDIVLNRFQFLMVRLKEKFYSTRHSIKQISIPYGAIKRKEDSDTKQLFRDFNSLWCD